jgi:hypothetical protein
MASMSSAEALSGVLEATLLEATLLEAAAARPHLPCGAATHRGWTNPDALASRLSSAVSATHALMMVEVEG